MSGSPAPKRKRLSCACTPCRNRKVRCDERQPKCSNCLRSGDECVTVDLRHPAATAVRGASCRQSSAIREDSARITDVDRNFTRGPDDINTEYTPATNAVTTAIGSASDPNEPPPHQARHAQPPPDSSGASQQTDLLPILPRFIRDGRHILTQWLDLAFLRLGLRDRFTILRNSQADEVFSFDAQHVAPLPPLPRADLYRGLALFRDNLGSVIHLPLPSEAAWPLEPCQLLVCHLACGAVALAKPGSVAVDIPLVIANALASVGRLTLSASLESVSALMLLAVIYRGTDKPEAAWHLVAAAVAMAHSLGINKARPASANANVVSSYAHDSAAVWWSLYILGKTLCLELERVSGIQDSECDQVDAPHASIETLAAIQLARVQSRISSRLLRSRQFEESGPYDLDRFGEEKTDAVHESALQLKMWEMNLPERLQPSRSFHIEDDTLTAKTFLSAQFHQTQVLLHRHALILSIQANRSGQEQESNIPRFQAGLADGYQRALRGCREIVHLLADADDRAAYSALDTAHALILAIYGLAIHLIKRPRLCRAGLDTELQKLAIKILSEREKRHKDSKIFDPNRMPESLRLTRFLSVMQSALGRFDRGTIATKSIDLRTMPSEYRPAEETRLEEMWYDKSGNSQGAPPPHGGFALTPQSTDLASLFPSEIGLDGQQQYSNQAFQQLGENFFDDDFISNATSWDFLADIVGLP